MESKTVYNFSAGPCVLPKDVLKTAQDELLDWHGTGISIMEMSHRSKEFTELTKEMEKNLRDLLKIPDNFEIFTFQGGASMQFSAICYNLLQGKNATYLTTGTWSQGALKEAKKYCSPTEAASNVSNGYTTIAGSDEWKIDNEGAYFHYCDNETIQGFEFNEFPYEKVGDLPIVCDMSSNFCSKPIDWSKFAMVYAGAQKNVGPAGVTFMIINKDYLGKARDDTPLLFDWATFAKAPCHFHNTPCCWSIYMCGLNIQKMVNDGGIEFYQKLAEQRSSMLYNYIDNSDGYFMNGVEKQYRSRMNVPFRVKKDDALEKKFIEEAKNEGLIQLSGHRSVGGLRASLYNAMPVEGVQALLDFMTKFRQNNP